MAVLKKTSGEDLKAGGERFRTLVEHVSDWIWEVDANGVYTYASPRIKDILGYAPEEIIGKTPFDLMPEEEAKKIEGVFFHLVEHKLPIKELENVNLHRDGHEVILETSGAPVMDAEGNCTGYRGVDRDITERKENERRQKQLLEIIEASPDFIASADVEGKVFYHNAAARNIIGKNRGSYSFVEANPDWAKTRILEEGIPAAVEKGMWKGETAILKQDGTEMPVSQIIVAHKSESGEVEFLSTIAHDITERKELEKIVHHQALYDALTDLPNRRYLHRKLDSLFARKEGTQKAALLFFDLDNFKIINDRYGHQTGDSLLGMVALRLKSCIRDGDFICRFGGDEFIIILENIRSRTEIDRVANRMVEAFSRPFQIGPHSIEATGSIGISLYPDHGSDEETLIAKADETMYEIKKHGKHSYKLKE
ncbi:diguanylate cyclase domain-containing protein [Heyndrickxia coagulans]|uniref:diguanylate cyclase domain-containing protein n=1 Tax=Heyndrickxia coagulans TaxID=1398 RepID=UPI002E1AD49D|nr:diguanylate cyclase [Heyndrickxia coagulans]